MLAQRNTNYLIKNIKQITENISQMLFDLKQEKLKSQGEPLSNLVLEISATCRDY